MIFTNDATPNKITADSSSPSLFSDRNFLALSKYKMQTVQGKSSKQLPNELAKDTGFHTINENNIRE